jgi:hypothetical protein
MGGPPFMLTPMLPALAAGWRGGEPRTFAVYEEDGDPALWPSMRDVSLVEINYSGGGITNLLSLIAAKAGVEYPGSYQALLENLEDLAGERPIVVLVRRAHRLLTDAGVELLHVIAHWESFTHHGGGVSAMYLVLQTGSRGETTAPRGAYPGRAPFEKVETFEFANRTAHALEIAIEPWAITVDLSPGKSVIIGYSAEPGRNLDCTVGADGAVTIGAYGFDLFIEQDGVRDVIAFGPPKW